MSDQVWLVIGSSRGLGRAVVEEALTTGNRVVATAPRPDALDDLAASPNGRLLAVPLDVTDPSQADSAMTQAVDAFGRVDVVVNVIGFANLAPVEDVSLADFRAEVDAVFFGTVHVIKAALPIFRRQGSGYFILVASIEGRLSFPGFSGYQSATFAVEGFAGVLRQEMAGLGIKVTTVEPGFMRTDAARSSMGIRDFQTTYEPIVGTMARRQRAINGTEPIDPAKVARVLLDLARTDEPPVHLVLGRHAIAHLADIAAATAAEDQKWAAVGRSVDFDG